MAKQTYAFEERAAGYLILRDFFMKKPTKEILRNLIDGGMFSIFPYIETDKALRDVCREMYDFCCTVTDTNINLIRVEYDDLFVINTPYNVYPYESPHRTSERLMMYKSVLSFQAFLNRYSLEVSVKNEPPDSLVNELDFLAQTSLLALKRQDDEALWILKDQKSFYELHLNVWVASFTQMLKQKARSEYYLKIADLLSLFVMKDYESISKMLVDK